MCDAKQIALSYLYTSIIIMRLLIILLSQYYINILVAGELNKTIYDALMILSTKIKSGSSLPHCVGNWFKQTISTSL